MYYKNIIYFSHINSIGGIETYFYQMAKKYKDRDITIFYKTGDFCQIQRLRKYIRVLKYTGEIIECEKAFFNFNLDIINNVKAKEYIQVLHGDYKALKQMPNRSDKITKYIGVSQVVCDSFKELTGEEVELVYNPFEIPKPRRMLILISATRLTPDKGRDRIIKMARTLDSKNIPYKWFIFTDNTEEISNPNIIYKKPTLDIIDYIAKSDYLVQLSDSEGYCYSVIEALSVGTPVIVTDMPVMKEIGVINGENGFIVDFDMNNIPCKDIYEKVLKFKYEPKKDTWDKYLAKGESTYKKLKVRANENYKKLNQIDAELGFVPEAGYVFFVDEGRLKALQNNKYKVNFVDVVD